MGVGGCTGAQPFGIKDLVILCGGGVVVWWLLCALAVVYNCDDDKEDCPGIKQECFDSVFVPLFH